MTRKEYWEAVHKMREAEIVVMWDQGHYSGHRCGLSNPPEPYAYIFRGTPREHVYRSMKAFVTELQGKPGVRNIRVVAEDIPKGEESHLSEYTSYRGYHHWTGWPGAVCLHCGAEDPMENAIGLGTFYPVDQTWRTPKDEENYLNASVCPGPFGRGCPQCPPREPPPEDVHFDPGSPTAKSICCNRLSYAFDLSDTVTTDPKKVVCGYWGKDHVYFNGDPGVQKWFFYDVDGNKKGPFVSQTEAHAAYDVYREEVLGRPKKEMTL